MIAQGLSGLGSTATGVIGDVRKRQQQDKMMKVLDQYLSDYDVNWNDPKERVFLLNTLQGVFPQQ